MQPLRPVRPLVLVPAAQLVQSAPLPAENVFAPHAAMGTIKAIIVVGLC